MFLARNIKLLIKYCLYSLSITATYKQHLEQNDVTKQILFCRYSSNPSIPEVIFPLIDIFSP